MFHT